MSLQRSLKVLFVAVGLLFLTFLTLLQVQQISRAQGDLVLSKTLNRSNNVVRVGELLSFTIVLTNNAGFTLTNVTLVDQYNQNVLGFMNATPAEDTHNPATGTITWNNVAAPSIPPGVTRTFTLFFQAEHPETAVVNLVRAQDITGTGGQLEDKEATEQVQESVGGAAPVVKFLSPPGSTPEVGQRVTFTHIITNDGAALMTYLPLTDSYNPAYLDFLFAIPPPNITSPPGTLVWTNLASATYFGPIPPDSSVVLTTVFSATTQVLNTENRASTEGAQDEFGNDLTAGSALVPITIIGSPTPVPTATPEDEDDDDDDDLPAPTPTHTPVPRPTPTPIPTQVSQQSPLTDTNTPLYLPETGRFIIDGGLIIPLFGLSLLTLGWYLFRIKKNQ